MTFRHCTYEEAKTLAGKHARLVSHHPAATYIGAFDGDKIVGAVGYMKVGNAVKCKSDIVLPEYRKRGIYSALFDLRASAIANIPHAREIAFCTVFSERMYAAHGFRPVRKYKETTLMERIV